MKMIVIESIMPFFSFSYVN